MCLPVVLLPAREDFRGFKESMLLYALEKGDVEGIFSDDGSDATVGYQTLTTAARRREWMLLSGLRAEVCAET